MLSHRADCISVADNSVDYNTQDDAAAGNIAALAEVGMSASIDSRAVSGCEAMALARHVRTQSQPSMR